MNTHNNNNNRNNHSNDYRNKIGSELKNSKDIELKSTNNNQLKVTDNAPKNQNKKAPEKPKMHKGKVIAIVTLSILLAISVGGGIAMSVVASNYMRETEGFYNKSYSQLVMDVNNIDTELSKLFVMNSDEAKAITLSEVSSIAVSAESSLENLPISKNGVSQLTKYFNQLMDYSKYLTKKVTRNTPITDEDMATVKQLYDVNIKLKKSINDSYDDTAGNTGLYSKGLLMNLNYIDPLDVTYDAISESNFEYPTMIYDGPFSDKKKQIENEPIKVNYTAEQAKEIAQKFDDKITNLTITNQENVEIKGSGEEEQNAENSSDTENQNNDTNSQDEFLVYSFSGEKNGQNVYVQVSKESGKVVLFDMYREVSDKNMDNEKLIQIAKEFLNKNGYEGVEVVWKDSTNNVLMLNLAYIQNDVVIYPDLVKIKIAMDNGEILGLEGLDFKSVKGELKNLEGKLSVEEAREKVNKKLTIETQRKAVIPINDKEFLTYEFSGKYEGMTFYVYIDAMTGDEINTLRVIVGSEGELVL